MISGFVKSSTNFKLKIVCQSNFKLTLVILISLQIEKLSSQVILINLKDEIKILKILSI